MNNIELDQIILCRKLILTTITNSFEVTVLIGLPQQFSVSEEDYYYPFKILGLEEDIVELAGGIDSIQALILALERIGKIFIDLAGHNLT